MPPVCVPDPRDVTVHILLHKIILAMVDHPGAIILKTRWSDKGADFGISCHPSDKGKLIGSQGRNARSIRVLMQAIGMQKGRIYTVRVNE